VTKFFHYDDLWPQCLKFLKKLVTAKCAKCHCDLCGLEACGNYRRSKLLIACFMTAPLTSEIDCVSGMSFGQASTQFCA
jgi:hypothetical protein